MTNKNLATLTSEEITELRNLLDQIIAYLGEDDTITITAATDRDVLINFITKKGK